MSKIQYEPIVPIHTKGKSLDIEQYIEHTSHETAMKTFERAKHRLLNPAIWHSLSGSLSAKFQLYDSNNTILQRLAEVGDNCRIDIIGPGTASGEGYDWVKIAAIQENDEKDADESVAVLLIPTGHPNNDPTKTAHFFDIRASSTFIIKRKGNKVFASYHGRNKVVNTNDVPVVDKLRNLVIAKSAAAGLSKLQWNSLIEGLLQPEIGGQSETTSSVNDAIF